MNKAICFLYIIGLLCFFTACSPQVVTPPDPVSSSPGISEHLFTSYDNTQLPMRVWLPSHDIDGVVIAVHGFNDYSNFIKDAAAFFNSHKLAVYAYDQRGFGASAARGRWGGSRAMAKDLTVFTQLVRELYPQVPIYILGESMGGAVTIVTMAAEDPPDVDGVILAAPAVWVRSEMPLYQRSLLWIAAHTMPWKKLTGKSLKITASDNIEMLRALGRDPLVIKETRVDALYGLSNLMDEAYGSAEHFKESALIVYGEKDEIIPPKPVADFYGRLPSKDHGQQLIEYEHGYHMLLRDLQSEVVLKDIVDWIKGHPRMSNLTPHTK